MRILVIDHYDARGNAIASSIGKQGRVVTAINHLPSKLDKLKTYATEYDLFLLHVGDDNAGDQLAAMIHFTEKPVLCFTAGYADEEVEEKNRSQEDLWCLCPGAEIMGRGITAEQFINSYAGKVICRYIQRIEEGGNPIDAKNELQGFSVELEEKLEKLYGMLQSGKQTEEVIEERNKLDALLTELAL